VSDRLDAVATALHARLGDRVTCNAASAELVTYRCGGPLAVAVRAETTADLQAVAETLPPDTDVLVIGRGSNLLVADAGFDGVAITLAGAFEELTIDADEALVDAGGAVPLPVLARRSAAAGIAGLEFYVGIPGSVGGAVHMNAGGHGADTHDVLVSAEIVDLDTGAVRTVERGALGLGYRTSALGGRDVVASARFAGTAGDAAEGGRRIDEIVRWRREHQPGGQNAGSVFTNPPGDAAGRLIEAAGCKGLRLGGAVVSEKHANFLVADTGARADDVHALIRAVQQRVEETSGIRLEPELRLIGFDRDDEETER
jgi:UDP-N-acetylmuramate dehydrogenase